jgi:hypothetical protein
MDAAACLRRFIAHAGAIDCVQPSRFLGNLCGWNGSFPFSTGDYRFDEASSAKVWPCSDEMVISPSGFSVTAQV